MALLPCDYVPHGHRGRNAYVYTFLGPISDSVRYLCRLCPEHLLLLHQDLSKFEWDPIDGATSPMRVSPDCLTCGKPLGEKGIELLVTSYPTKDECKYYRGNVHTGCQVNPLLLTREWNA